MNVSDEFKNGGVKFESYGKVFKFHAKHSGAKTDDDFKALVSDLEQFTGEFERNLMVIAVEDIESEYERRKGRTSL